MRIIAAIFDNRAHAEDAIERLHASGCVRRAMTFLPERELTEFASRGGYDWRADKWGLWRRLAIFERMSDPDRYCFGEGMHRGGSVLLVAAKNNDLTERYGTILVEAGAVDLDERERSWREAGWSGLDGDHRPQATNRPSGHSSKVRVH